MKYSNVIQEAIDEQLRSSFPDYETDKYGRPVRELGLKPRRRTETILIEMVDKLRTLESTDVKLKKKKRRRKRGPRVLVFKTY